MPNNRKRTKGRIKQTVYSEPRRIRITFEKVLTPTGERLVAEGKMTRKAALKKYGKHKYRINPRAVPVKVVDHPYMQ